jgi:hypothetical protein
MKKKPLYRDIVLKPIIRTVNLKYLPRKFRWRGKSVQTPQKLNYFTIIKIAYKILLIVPNC